MQRVPRFRSSTMLVLSCCLAGVVGWPQLAAAWRSGQESNQPASTGAGTTETVGSTANGRAQDSETTSRSDEAKDSESRRELNRLHWLLGRWKTAADAPVPAQAKGFWSPDGNFLLLDYQVMPPDGQTMLSSERIAWDPVAKQFRSWTFRGDGGFGQANWVARENGWLIRYTGSHGDGRAFSATLLLSLDGDKTLQLSAIERWAGEEKLADLVVEMQRVGLDEFDEPRIEGSLWELTRLNSQPVRVPSKPTLKLVDGEVEAFGGINRIGGGYRLDGHRLSFRALVSTLMGGPLAESELEQEFTSVLEEVNRAAIIDGELILWGDDRELARFRVREPDGANPSAWQEVHQTRWRLVELKGVPVAVDVDSPPTLRLNEGAVEAFGGINRMSGSYNFVDGTLTFGPLRSTAIGGSPASLRLETTYAEALAATDSFKLEDGRLLLLGGQEVLARFAKIDR